MCHHPSSNRSRIPHHLAFPKAEHFPSVLFGVTRGSTVTLLIPFDLRCPIVRVRSRELAFPMDRASMPEAAVNKNGDFLFWKGYVSQDTGGDPPLQPVPATRAWLWRRRSISGLVFFRCRPLSRWLYSVEYQPGVTEDSLITVGPRSG